MTPDDRKEKRTLKSFEIERHLIHLIHPSNGSKSDQTDQYATPPVAVPCSIQVNPLAWQMRHPVIASSSNIMELEVSTDRQASNTAMPRCSLKKATAAADRYSY